MSESPRNAALTEAEVQKFGEMAAQITGNDHLEQILQHSSIANRRTMYLSLLQYLTFKPKPYWWFSQRAKKRLQ